MGAHQADRSRAFYAEIYDVSVSDWPAEIEFYSRLAREAAAAGAGVLELACGTGRVAIPLAQQGARIVGLDVCTEMLFVARRKANGISDIRWGEADMRSFDLEERFGLVIIPGHSFQNLLTPDDQHACLAAVARHLLPRAQLAIHVDHLEVDWLGELVKEGGDVFEDAERFAHPLTGRQIRASRAWSYEPHTQTAIQQTVWEEIDDQERVTNRWETGPVRIHCVFRFEMEHLLARAGLRIKAVTGDFRRSELTDESAEMIWIARSQA